MEGEEDGLETRSEFRRKRVDYGRGLLSPQKSDPNLVNACGCVWCSATFRTLSSQTCVEAAIDRNADVKVRREETGMTKVDTFPKSPNSHTDSVKGDSGEGGTFLEEKISKGGKQKIIGRSLWVLR